MNSLIPKYLLYQSLWFLLLLASCESNGDSYESSEAIHHVKVYHEDGQFAGWPANNGIWNWNDEILVGFVQADHMEKSGHTYDVSTSHYKYARSYDGGMTWEIEDANEGGQTAWTYQNQVRDKSVEPEMLTESMDFSNPNFVITFSRITNHTGPSIYYYSNDRGKQWEGPYKLPNLDTPGIATRTDYIIEGSRELNAFVTVAKSNEKEGRVAMFKTEDGGITWERKSWLGPEPKGFEIMSSTIRISDDEILSIIRGREVNPRRDYLKAYRSTDNGETWQDINDPVVDTGAGGSPPALIKMNDGRLALAYAFRSQFGSRICLRMSDDNGESWSHEIPIRTGDGATADIGYPRMIQREDGKLVIIYYWNHALQEEAAPYRFIAASIVDPDNWK